MPRHKGSTKSLPPLSQRNMKLFLNIKAEIERIGVDKVAEHGTISGVMIYSFLTGSQGLSPQAEEGLIKALELAQVAESAELTKLDQKWEKLLSA